MKLNDDKPVTFLLLILTILGIGICGLVFAAAMHSVFAAGNQEGTVGNPGPRNDRGYLESRFRIGVGADCMGNCQSVPQRVKGTAGPSGNGLGGIGNGNVVGGPGYGTPR